MKKLIPLIVVFFMSVSNLSAQSKAVKEVENTVETMRLAMISGDRNVLNKLASDQLTYGHSSGKIESKTDFVETLATKKSDFKSITLSQQTVDVQCKTAVVRHVLDADTFDGGKPGKVHLGIVLVFAKDGSNWKLLARQAFKLP
ncbi:nuclear transport factor 2 family protein [Pseudopedobacter beijingensis]|uniref:Nuclear transport factor 2 family protein n=1 Tax=Pseudopedobacter beijingensis TaxID=1207056 RepID=A0ABW4IH34_9SPHI